MTPDTQSLAHKRIFLALWPDETVRQQLYEFQKKLKHDPSLDSALQSARAVIPENLHMTLHFIGSISIEVLQALEDALDSVQSRVFEMDVNTVGYFPRPRVLWLGLDQTPPSLQELGQQMAVAIQQCVEGYGYKSFHPHITLFRKVKKLGVIVAHPVIRWPVQSFALVESKTLAEGVQYSVLKEWPLLT